MANVKEFSVEEKLLTLLHLQKIESKLDEVQILKGELPMEVRDLEDEIQGLHARETRIEEEVNGINEFIAQKREAIATAEALIKKYEKQSDNVKNNREYEAIQKEIEMQTLEMRLAEKHIKDANQEIADKAGVLDAAKKNIAEKEANLKHKKGELDKIIGETEKEENEFRTKADAAKFGKWHRMMLERGVYLAPSMYEAGFMSMAHTDEDIERTLAIAEEVMSQL